MSGDPEHDPMLDLPRPTTWRVGTQRCPSHVWRGQGSARGPCEMVGPDREPRSRQRPPRSLHAGTLTIETVVTPDQSQVPAPRASAPSSLQSAPMDTRAEASVAALPSQ